jgi:hypothetical protein
VDSKTREINAKWIEDFKADNGQTQSELSQEPTS